MGKKRRATFAYAVCVFRGLVKSEPVPRRKRRSPYAHHIARTDPLSSSRHINTILCVMVYTAEWACVFGEEKTAVRSVSCI